MRKFNRWTTIAAVAGALLGNSAEAALVQYAYTGNPFDDSATVPPERLTIQFTIDDSLVPVNGHFVLSSASPFSSFSFSDGRNVIDNNPPAGYSPAALDVFFDTDANGNVSNFWHFRADQSHINDGPRPDLVLHVIMSRRDDAGNTADLSQTNSCCSEKYSLAANNNPGSWVRTLVPVPLPGGLLLFMSALGGLCFKRRLLSFRGVPQRPAA